jgi:hypothetical protein
LTKAVSGDVIQLVEEIYTGRFSYKSTSETGITIQGAGQEKTIIQQPSSRAPPLLQIHASNCTIKDLSISSTWIPNEIEDIPNLQVQGNNNTLTNISIAGGEIGVQIDGSSNNLEHLSFRNMAYTCLQINGNSNTVSNTGFNLAGHACCLTGNENNLSNFTMEDVAQGIILSGKDDVIENLKDNTTMSQQDIIIKLKEVLNADDDNVTFNAIADYSPYVVLVRDGKNHSISRVHITGVTRDNTRPVHGIRLHKTTEHCQVDNYECDGVNGVVWDIIVEGQFHSLKEINGVNLFYVGGTGHRLEKCSARQLVRIQGEESVQDLVDCNFLVTTNS